MLHASQSLKLVSGFKVVRKHDSQGRESHHVLLFQTRCIDGRYHEDAFTPPTLNMVTNFRDPTHIAKQGAQALLTGFRPAAVAISFRAC